jgi:hypothetical protein
MNSPLTPTRLIQIQHNETKLRLRTSLEKWQPFKLLIPKPKGG